MRPIAASETLFPRGNNGMLLLSARFVHARSRITRWAGLAACALILSAAPAAARAAALDFDRDTWAAMLAAHTEARPDVAGTRVDYAALTRDPQWRAFVTDLTRRSPPSDRAGRMAFWIDAYNVLAIDMVVRNWPVESIRDVGSFFKPVWKLDAGAIDGRRITLHEIEHEILRPMRDPRIHMAIVCASTSCPTLAREPFHASDLDARLDAAVGRFLDDPRKGLDVHPADGEISLSRIFDWFEVDFAGEGGVGGFIVKHLEDTERVSEDDRAWLRASAQQADVRLLPYDWTVNALER